MSLENPPPPSDSGEVQAQLQALQQQIEDLRRTQRRKDGSRWRAFGIGALLVLAGGGVTAVAQTVTSDLRAFSAGSPALADDVNFNFNLLKQWIEHKVGPAKTPQVTMYSGVKYECDACGSTSTLNGSENWGDLTIQGRVLSANGNIHLSPPGGANVIIDDAYRAAGGTNVGTAGLQVEGNVTSAGLIVNGKALGDHIRDYVRNNCYVYFGWADSCDGGCDGQPAKYGYIRGDNTCTLGLGGDSECSNGIYSRNWLGLNPDGDVNGDDKFFVSFFCN